MKLKVCGMRENDNIQELMTLEPDYLGMIFYPNSSRYVTDVPTTEITARKVGVFVDATEVEICEKSEAFGFDMVQLHGSEPVALLLALKKRGFSTIKVFSVQDQLPVSEMKTYLEAADYFLFDTKTPKYGGSGHKFDWGILLGYEMDKPFFLSGGIDLDDVEKIKKLAIPQLYAIDINSRFEISPALKDINKISAFKKRL